jgi:pimeloyl-ACP methyl ester carboxylesterase
LTVIKRSTLVVNGSSDIMVPTINSWIMLQHIPNAQLIVSPDPGHAAHYQYRKSNFLLSNEKTA